MKRITGFLPIILALFAACDSGYNESSKPVVVVSIAPQKYFVQRIADTLVNVEVMVPSGSSPETYEPTASQLRIIGKAEAYFSLGLMEFELSVLKRIQKQNHNLHVVNHSKSLNLMESECHDHHQGHSHHQGHDPHVWTSPLAVKRMVNEIVSLLSKRFPEHSNVFYENSESFLNDIDELDTFIKSELEDVKSTKFFIFHPALTYYARDYGLTQIAFEEDGKSPSMQYFKSVLNEAQKQGANTIFIQKEFDVNTAKTAATDIKGKVEVIDPLKEDWLENMYEITGKLKKALN
ncbi:MAG: metal ABC transporter solute-binding protein, Zn/Mn family [Bacteroidales bacterium]